MSKQPVDPMDEDEILEDELDEMEEEELKDVPEENLQLTLEEEKEMERIEKIRSERNDMLKKLRAQQSDDESTLSDDELKLSRFNNLLAQTELFSVNLTVSQKSSTKKKSGGPKRKSGRVTEKQEDDEILHETLEDEEHSHFSRLTTSPNYIEKTKLRSYQLHGLNWLIKMYDNGMNGILADEMGLGKTLQTISFLGYLKHFRGVTMPSIVIVPKSVLANWMNEFAKWCPTIRAIKFHGDPEERARFKETKLIVGTFDVLVTTYEMSNIERLALRKIRWKYLIMDEAHRIKNETSVLSRCVRLFRTSYRLLLTGTPLQNNLHELWALLNYILPEVFSSASEFDQWFKLKEGQEDSEIMSHLHKILKPFMLRRLKADVEREIPPKKEIYVECGMSVLQKEWYKSILTKDANNISAIKGRERVKLLNVVMQLRKVCNHPYLFDGAEPGPPFTNDTHIIENSGKMNMLDRLLVKLKTQGSRVLIFSQMTRMLNILEDYCFLKKYEYCRIDGQTSARDRENYLEEYNRKDSSKFIFLLSTRAGGLGINLATADTVILYDSDWNPQADLQAQDRAHRIGQTKPVNVYRLISKGTIEEKVYQRAVKKLYLDAVVIQQGRLVEQNQSLSRSELLGMITFGAEEIFKTTDESSISDEQLDAILQRGERKAQEMDKTLKESVQTNLLNFSLTEDANLYEFEGLDYSQKPTSSIVLEGVKDLDETQIRALCKETESSVEEVIMSSQKNSVIIYFRNKTAASKAIEILNVSGYKPKYCKKNDFLTQQIESGVIKQGDFLDPGRRNSKYRSEEYLIKDNRYKGPKEPKFNEWQFFDEKRLLELWEKERDYFLSKREDEEVVGNGLTQQEQEEKTTLSQNGFSNWNKKDYYGFIKGVEKFGRVDYAKIATLVEGKTEQEIKEYAQVFFEKMNTLSDYEKLSKRISRGEQTLEKIKNINMMLQWKTQKYANPWAELTVEYDYHDPQFTQEEDAFLICFMAKMGYGDIVAFDLIRYELMKCFEFRFDFFIKTRNAIELQRRGDYLIKLIEKEYSVETGTVLSGRKRVFSDKKKRKKRRGEVESFVVEEDDDEDDDE